MATEANPPMTVPAAESVHSTHVPESRGAKNLGWIGLVCLAILVGMGVYWGIHSRHSAETNLEQVTERDSVVTVSVVHPSTISTGSDVSLPGNTQAFNDTPIYARTNGYLRNFYVDIGQHVRKGQLMAIIETPEVDQQLQVAEADLKSAQADLKLADVTSERYQNLLKQDSVSKQETDVAVSGAAAKLAAVQAAEANVRRLQQLQSFERIYAPFDGVVTARNTDIGDLIDAGAGSAQPRDLFHVASASRLRIFVPVPEVYVPAIHDGDKATLTLDEYPGQTFTGTITRNSSAINTQSRTLNVEVDIDNRDGKLLPGAYVFVHFKLPGAPNSVSVPSNALLFRAQGLQAALVRDGKVHLQPVTIGKDNGATMAIATGLKATDNVIIDPPDSLTEGQTVHIAVRKQEEK